VTADPISLRWATVADLDDALPVIRGFYRHFEFPWDEDRKRAVLLDLLADPGRGRLLLVRHDERVIGYALIAFYLSLEFDGRVALLDELFLRPETRGAGVGARLLEHLAASLKAEGIPVVRLEVDDRHPEAASLYARHGFRTDDRRTWSRRI